jgi:hypothetical protein
MPSLLKQLFDTLPLAGAADAAMNTEHEAGTAPTSVEALQVETLAQHLFFVEDAAALGITVTSARPTGTGGATSASTIPIWRYRTSSPTEFADIGCRVRADAYNEYLVLRRAAWGTEVGDGLEPSIAIEVLQRPVTLVLNEATRLMTFRTLGGCNTRHRTHLWPLEAQHDEATMHVFVFDVHPVTLQVIALKDPDHPEAGKVGELLATCRNALGTGRDESYAGKVGAQLFVDDLWLPAIDLDNVYAFPGEVITLFTRPFRVVVAVSLTPCRENWDYTPASATGMGRLYPQLFVKCNAALSKVQATLQMDRPEKMTLLDGHMCGCGEMKDNIGSLMVTDANAGMEVMRGSIPVPGDHTFSYWSNLFAYLVPNFYENHGATVMNVVRNDRPRDRIRLDLLKRRPVTLSGVWVFEDDDENGVEPSDERGRRVRKLARQGAFDNIHMAPRMQLKPGKVLRVREITQLLGLQLTGTDQPIDLAEWRLDDVVMAPFCAHDCFHMHWRWGELASDKWVFGWGRTGPYTVPGAPMIPLNHELDIRLRADNLVSYRARALGVAANEPVVFNHHGAAYALDVGFLVTLARQSADLAQEPAFIFMSDVATSHLASNSWAAFYWHLRYEVWNDQGTFKPRERTDIYDLNALLHM